MSKILVVSTQYPGYGGAATNAYAIIKHLRLSGYDVVGAFFEDNRTAVADPDNIGNVYKLPYYPFVHRSAPQISQCRIFLSNILGGFPKIVLCKNYMAPVISKYLFPKIKRIYFVSGLCNVIETCTKYPANRMVTEKIVLPVSELENSAMSVSDKIVLNSKLTMELTKIHYPQFTHKLYENVVDSSNCLCSSHSEIMCSDKIYDIIVTASILTRPEKNLQFLVDILKHDKLKNLSKIFIGNDNSMFKDIPNSTVLQLVPNIQLMKYMAQSKLLLYPSLYDSSPNTVREAINNRCLTLLSNNIGFCESFPDYSVCTTYNEQEWIDKTVYLIENFETVVKDYNIDFSNCVSITQAVEQMLN